MDKKIIEKFGKHYLLGVAAESGRHVYLEAPSWDCGWYWGFGYLHSFTNDRCPEKSADINEHFHFDGAFLESKQCAFDAFKGYFRETVLTDDEIWMLCDYMRTFYTLKDAAELFYSGSSHYTEKAKVEILKDESLWRRINEELLPAVFDKIDRMLSPNVG